MGKLRKLINNLNTGTVGTAIANRLESKSADDGDGNSIADIANNGVYYSKNCFTKVQGGQRCFDGTRLGLVLPAKTSPKIIRNIWATDDGKEYLIVAYNAIEEETQARFPAFKVFDVSENRFEEVFNTQLGDNVNLFSFSMRDANADESDDDFYTGFYSIGKGGGTQEGFLDIPTSQFGGVFGDTTTTFTYNNVENKILGVFRNAGDPNVTIFFENRFSSSSREDIKIKIAKSATTLAWESDGNLRLSSSLPIGVDGALVYGYRAGINEADIETVDGIFSSDIVGTLSDDGNEIIASYPNNDEFDVIAERLVFDEKGGLIDIQRKSSTYFSQSNILSSIHTLENGEVGDDGSVVDKYIPVNPTINSRIGGDKRVYVGVLHGRRNNAANGISGRQNIIETSKWTLYEEDSKLKAGYNDDGNKVYEFADNVKLGDEDEASELSVNLLSLSRIKEGVYGDFTYENEVDKFVKYNNDDSILFNANASVQRIDRIGLLGAEKNGNVLFGKEIGDRRYMVVYVIKQKDTSNSASATSYRKAKEITDYFSNSAVTWDTIRLRNIRTIETSDIWRNDDTKTDGIFIQPENLELSTYGNEAYLYDRSGDNPPIRLVYDVKERTFEGTTVPLRNFYYVADNKEKMNLEMTRLGYPEDETERAKYWVEISKENNKQVVSFINARRESDEHEKDLAKFEKRAVPTKAELDTAFTKFKPFQLIPEPDIQTVTETETDEDGVETTNDVERDVANIDISEAIALPSGFYYAPFSKHTGYHKLVFAYQVNIFCVGGNKTEDLFMSTAYDKLDWAQRVKTAPFQNATENFPEYEEESNIFTNLGMILPVHSSIIWAGTEARLLLYTNRNPISLDAIDPTEVQASKIRNYEQFKVNEYVQPIVADNATIVLSTTGELYRQEIIGGEDSVQITFGNMLIDRLPPSLDSIRQVDVKTNKISLRAKTRQLLSGEVDITGMSYWIDRRDGSRRILLPNARGECVCLTLSNENSVKAFSVLSFDNNKIKSVVSLGNKLFFGIEKDNTFQIHTYDDNARLLGEVSDSFGNVSGDEVVKEFAPYVPSTYSSRNRYRRVFKIYLKVEDIAEDGEITFYIKEPGTDWIYEKTLTIPRHNTFVKEDTTTTLYLPVSINLSENIYQDRIGGIIIKTEEKGVFSQIEFDIESS